MTDSERGKPIISTATGGDPPVDLPQEEGDLVADVEVRRVAVPAQSHGARVDRALAGIVPEFSRSYLQQLIEAGMVVLNGVPVSKASTKVKAADELAIELRPTPQSQAFKAESMPLDIVFEDACLWVINKPAGLVVHPAPGNWSGTLLNGLLAHDAAAASIPRAGIVHRLDKDTSGLMVVARQRQTMDQLVSMIAARTVRREYVALAHGAWTGSQTREVDAAIGRDPRNRLRMAVVDPEKNAGKPATTTITLRQTAGPYSFVKCRLHTGRTHQIRVHMAFLGHPLVADELYGGAPAAGLQRQALHACRLAFVHPVTGESMEFRSRPPSDFLTAMDGMGLIYNEIE